MEKKARKNPSQGKKIISFFFLFFKFIISLRGGRCDLSNKEKKKKLAKPLLRYVVQRSTLSHYMGGPKKQRTLIAGLATRRLWMAWVALLLSVYSRNTDAPLIM
jgi:hypothetical protein